MRNKWFCTLIFWSLSLSSSRNQQSHKIRCWRPDFHHSYGKQLLVNQIMSLSRSLSSYIAYRNLLKLWHQGLAYTEHIPAPDGGGCIWLCYAEQDFSWKSYSRPQVLDKNIFSLTLSNSKDLILASCLSVVSLPVFKVESVE